MFLMENWYLVVALMAVAGMVGVCIGRFLKMPTSEQRERVKEWLLWAVTQAEAELGSGHREAEAAADLRFIYPAVPCIGYGGILRHLLPVGG